MKNPNQIPTFPQFNTKFATIKVANEIQIHTSFETNLRILHNGTYYLTPCLEKFYTIDQNITTETAIIDATQRFINLAYLYSLHSVVDINQKDSFGNNRFTPDTDQRTENERTLPSF
mgnify:CR=1 FL=1